MPIYELRCERCGHQFEELVFRRSEIEELACPRCGAADVGLLLSTFASAATRPAGGGGTSSGGGCGTGGFS
jgi:putative FmdB family regulatory protein